MSMKASVAFFHGLSHSNGNVVKTVPIIGDFSLLLNSLMSVIHMKKSEA